MIPLSEAREVVLDACRPGVPVPVPIGESPGCVVGVPVVAEEPVPPFVNSSRDGYALRSADTATASKALPARLRVVGSIMAGTVFEGAVGHGEAVRIMTGAPLPAGADAVCMLEDSTDEDDGSVVVIGQPVAAGEAVRGAGEDVAVGDVVAEPGTVVTPGHVGVFANLGMTVVTVHPRPRVGVLSTGDELAPDPGPLRPGQIHDANRPALLALVDREGWDALDLGVVGDDEAALGRAFDRAADTCDVLVTSGGVSVGDLDIVKVVLEKRCSGTMRWMQVAIKPAKPFAFGTLAGSGTPVFGLPGNPVSAMVSFELLVRPAVRRLAGHRSLEHPVVPAIAARGLHRGPDGKTHFVRATVSLDERGTWVVRPMTGQDSHHLRAMADANSLAVLPDGDGVDAGGTVDVILTDPDRLVVEPPLPEVRGW
jgi:molybdenum cofactor synthesis domain-containing protein